MLTLKKLFADLGHCCSEAVQTTMAARFLSKEKEMKPQNRLLAPIAIFGLLVVSALAILPRAEAGIVVPGVVSNLLTAASERMIGNPGEQQSSAIPPARNEDEPDEKFIRSQRRIAGKYIVVLRDSAAGPRGENSRAREVANELSAIHGGRIDRVFTHAINAFSAEMNEGQAIALSKDPRVEYVEEDAEITLNATQTNAPWGLDRVDQRGLPLDTLYNYTLTGTGVRAYIIDSGIRTTHTEFEGRASVGFDAFGQSGQDCFGHGTHVAGTVGGATWGVAKNVSLVGVRVFDCGGNGSTSLTIAGVDWVTVNAVKPAVANMSLGYEVYDAGLALDTAVNNSINTGLTYVIAAGNSNKSACDISPARVGSAITVGAADMADQRASFSNYGLCVDLFAPGVDITSAWHTTDTATQISQGTSMAAPHVAGAAAMYLQMNPGANAQQVRAFLTSETTKDIVTSSNSANDHLLFALWGATPILPINIAPAASFTYSCAAGQTCTFDGTGSTDADGTVAAYHWNFGDGFSASGPAVQHTFNLIGNYTVSLTVSDNLGEASFPDTENLNIVNTPVGNNVTVNQKFGYGSVTFSQVTVAGNTRLDQLFVVPPYDNTICDTCPMLTVSTTATYTGPVTACLDVPAAVDDQTFNSMYLLRYSNLDNPPVNITTNRITNQDGTREICGQSPTLGIYAIATQLAGPPPQSPPTLSNTAVTPVMENGIATLSGNISDPNAGDTFTLTVNWGDGSQPQAFNYAAGTTSFGETHRYLDNPAGQPNGIFLLNMTLADSAGGQTGSSLNAGVSNVAPTLNNISASPSTLTAGGTTTVSGNITDPGTLDNVSVTIDWRDPTSGSTTLDLPAGTTSFSSQHQYNVPGTYILNVVVRDKDNAATVSNPAATVTVTDAPAPELTNVSVTSPISENGSATLSGNISSQVLNTTFALEVNWGDGGQPQIFNYQAGTTSFSETHQYRDNPAGLPNGSFAINLTLSDINGAKDTDSASVTVNNVAPSLSDFLLNPMPITAGGSTTLTGSSTDPGTLDTQVVTIDWGDGSANTPLNLNAGQSGISVPHQYTQAGDFNIVASAVDKDGAQSSTGVTIKVVAAPPPPSPTPVPPRVGNMPFTEIGLDGSAFAGLTPGPDGRLYGVTYDGPVSDDVPSGPKLDEGTIYSVDRNLTNRIDHHKFIAATDGSTPYNELTFNPANGKLYGTTSAGGQTGPGTIFTYDPATDQFYATPWSFTGAIWGSLVLSNGFLYGTAQSFPEECVFRVSADLISVTNIHCVGWGASLQGLTLGDDGWLYGNSLYSGIHCDPARPSTGCGEIFKVRPLLPNEPFEPQFQTIFQFQFYGGRDYPCPPNDKFCVRFPYRENNPVQQLDYGSDGYLYGATALSIFRLDPHAGDVAASFRTLWNDGGGVQATVIEGADGRLYVTDYGGGTEGAGRILSMYNNGSGVFELRNFTLLSGSTAYGPYGRLYHDPNTKRIYGTTEYTDTPLGTPAPGTVFAVEIPPTEYRLSGSADGTAPVVVDDALDVFVNDALMYTDGIAPSGERGPIPVPEGFLKPGDEVRFEVRDVYGDCRLLSPIYLVDNFGTSTLMTAGLPIKCGFPAGDNGVVFADTFTLSGTRNTAPVIGSLTAPTTLNENDVASLSFLVSDPDVGNTLDITINWGDGSPNETYSTPAANNIPFNLFHRYLDDDPGNTASDSYQLTVSVTDGPATDTESRSVLVNNLAPSISGLLLTPSSITVGGSTTLNGTFTDAGTSDSFTVRIDWGDGSQPIQLSRPSGSTTFSSGHQYLTAGSFTIVATVTDDDTGEVTSSAPPLVVSPPSPIPAAPAGLVATGISRTQIDLAWIDNSDNETGFEIVQCNNKKCSTTTLVATVGANIATFSHTGLAANTNYIYRVRALNGGVSSAYSNVATGKTLRK